MIIMLYANRITTAEEVRQQFANLDRDYYPLEVYQTILDIEDDLSDCSGQARELDVIGWCCEINEVTIDDYNTYKIMQIDKGDIDKLKSVLTEQGAFIYGVDYDKGIVYCSDY